MEEETMTDSSQEVTNDEGCTHGTFPTVIKTESPDDQIDIKPTEISAIKGETNSLLVKSCGDDPSKCDFPSPCKTLPSSFQGIKPFPPIVKEEVHIPEVKVEFSDETDDSNFRCSVCSMSFVNQRIYSMHFNVSHRTPPSVSTQTHSVLATNSGLNSAKPNVKRSSVSATKKLIESVRNNPCLYNTDNENFNNEDLKTLTWTTIAAECNFPNGASAKAEWKNLLIRLSNSVTIGGQGQASRVQKAWRYKKQMEFVLPYMTDEEIHTFRHTDTTNYHNRHSQRIETLQSTKRKRQDTVEASTSNADGGQPLDMFFLSMCATTKNLPSYVQLQVKKKIFNAVIEAEEIVAAMHNDQAKNSMSMFDATPSTHDDEYQNNLSPFSVQSNADEEWQE